MGRPGRAAPDNYAQQKYTSTADDIPLARYAEAQLILAEVKGGAAAVQHINNIRAANDLPLYQGPTDDATIRNLIIEERRREFFFEGRFLAEKLRKDLGFPQGVGTNHKGITYGRTTCFMMPITEYENNPNIPEDTRDRTELTCLVDPAVAGSTDNKRLFFAGAPIVGAPAFLCLRLIR